MDKEELVTQLHLLIKFMSVLGVSGIMRHTGICKKGLKGKRTLHFVSASSGKYIKFQDAVALYNRGFDTPRFAKGLDSKMFLGYHAVSHIGSKERTPITIQRKDLSEDVIQELLKITWGRNTGK